MVWWLCYVGAPGMCGGWCGVARWCPRKCAVRRCSRVRPLARGRLGWWFHPQVWFALWLMVRAGLVCGMWRFRGWCWGGPVWCGAGVVGCRSCVGRLRCSMSLGLASWCVAVFRAGRSGEVRVGGGGECGVMWWGWVVCWLPHWGGSIVSGSVGLGGCSWLVIGQCGPVRRGLMVVSLGFPCLRAVWGLGPLGWGVRDRSVATRGAWLRGAWVCRPTVEWVQGRGERRLWALCGLRRLWGPRVGGSRHHGRVVAPMRRPWVVCGFVWLGCIVSMVRRGPWARTWGWSLVGHRLVAGAGASLWVGLPWCLLGVSRGGPWSAGCGGLLRSTASIGAPLCVGGSLWGLRWVVGAWLVSVSSVWFAVVRHVSSSAVPLGALLWRCVEGGLGLGASWEGAGHARLGWLGGWRARVCACPATFAFLACGVPGVSALCSLRGFLLCPSPYPLFLPVPFFFWGGVCVVGVRCLRCWALAWVGAAVGVGVDVMAR